MSFPQSKLEDWARQMGETHGEWIQEVIQEAYMAGYTEAFPHAAKHTMEKALDIIQKELGDEARDAVFTVLTEKKWQ